MNVFRCTALSAALLGLLAVQRMPTANAFDFINEGSLYIEDFEDGSEYEGKIEPKECFNALRSLGDVVATDGECVAMIGGFLGFLGGFSLPDISVSVGGIDIDIGLPAAPDTLGGSIEQTCDSGQCVQDMTTALQEIDENCVPGELQKLNERTSRFIKYVRHIIEGVCKQDDAGNYCLATLVESLREARDVTQPFSVTQQVRAGLCSPCSKAVQKDIYAVLDPAAPIKAHTQILCIEDEETKEYCPPLDLLDGAAFAARPNVWKLVFNEESLCSSSCKTQCISVLARYYWYTGASSDPFPLVCFEESADPDAVRFSVRGLVDNLSEADWEALINQLKSDIALAFQTARNFVDIFRKKEGDDDEGARYLSEGLGDPTLEVTVSHQRVNGTATSEEIMRNALQYSPFSDANSVPNIAANPTKSLEVDVVPAASEEPSSGMSTGIRFVTIVSAMAASMFFGGAMF